MAKKYAPTVIKAPPANPRKNPSRVNVESTRRPTMRPPISPTTMIPKIETRVPVGGSVICLASPFEDREDNASAKDNQADQKLREIYSGR